MDKFKESISSKTQFGEKAVEFNVGGDDLPEPIAIRLIQLGKALNPALYEADEIKKLSARCDFSHSVLRIKSTHVTKALEEYPRKMGAIEPKGEQTCRHFVFSWNYLHFELLITVHLQTHQSAFHSPGQRALSGCPRTTGYYYGVHGVQREAALGILEASFKTAKTMIMRAIKMEPLT